MRICIRSMLGSMLRRDEGAVALIFGLLAPALIGVAGIAVDFARYNHTHANLQGLADGAAVAAVQSMAVANMAASAPARNSGPSPGFPTAFRSNHNQFPSLP